MLIATKKDRADTNTNRAQGGIACVVDPADSFEQHVYDTLDAGAGLCDERVVHEIVRAGPASIAEHICAGTRSKIYDYPLEQNPWDVEMVWGKATHTEAIGSWLRKSIKTLVQQNSESLTW